MAHESFEDSEVAEYLNQYFISIKVDKEERPDVDSIYMSVCQSLTGSGGWPLTIFMLPDQKPFYAGTYFPKKSKYNMPGFLDLLEAVKEKWETSREELILSSEGITNSLNKEIGHKEEGEISKDLVEKSAQSLIQHFDKEYGGFGRAPKFPTPHNLMFLLRYAYHEQSKKALEVTEKTLDAMYRGGIFDHIGFGFSRYSTDDKWLAPHFEKMLYDNGLLILTYLEAYQLTQKKHYRRVAEMTMEYILRELTSKEGGFFCAQDADSEGVEGKYYVFTPEEIIKVLGKEDGNYFNEYFDITSKGNFEGKNIPNRIQALKLGRIIETNSEETNRITALRIKIYEYRLQRTKLHKDDKILTSWNGIMIVAFAKAYQILGEERYKTAGVMAEEFLRKYLSQEERLLVHYRDGVASGNGHIDDYAFYSYSLIGLYEATLDVQYLERAVKYTKVMIRKFFDAERGGFYLYADDGEMLIHRPKEIYDGAIPSGNSVAAYVLQKLGRLTADMELIETANKQTNFVASQISQFPSAYCFSVMALMQVIYPAKELVCATSQTQVTEIKNLLGKLFMPGISVLLKTEENKEKLSELAPFTKDYPISPEKSSYYLCENQACLAPVHDVKELDKLLSNL